jgi:hypothetical protein
MVDYGEGIKRPFQDWKKFALGTLLAMIPIISFISAGYALKCAKITMGKKKNKYSLPEWDDIGGFFVKGFSAFIINLIYSLAGMVLIGYVLAKAILAMLANQMAFTDDLAFAFAQNVPLLLAGIVLLLIAAFISPLAIMNYVKYDKFSAAFKFSEILSKINGAYILTWIVAIVFSVVIVLLFSVIQIPLIGGASLATFWLMITMYTWFAEAYMS